MSEPAERILLFTQCLQNDFVRPLGPGERLPNQLHIGRDVVRGVPPDRVKVGIIGVWTDVKVHYLAYDVMTRLGLERIAVSGALVASRSRSRHRGALDHLREMLSIEVLDSIPEFLAWL